MRVQDARALIDAFDPQQDPIAMANRTATLALLDNATDAFERSMFQPGHITGSAVVFDPIGDAIVLVRHARVGGWVQPGGHVETGDASVLAAARREVVEETGLELMEEPGPLVRVDVHAIPPAKGEPAHLHHDLTFALVASAREAARTGEVTWTWCPIPDLREFDVDASLQRSVARALDWFQSREPLRTRTRAPR